MIYHSQHIKSAVKTQIQNFLKIKPIPQLQVWENCARQFLNKGLTLEACMILDIMASHYGRQMGKTVSERVLQIPLNQTGRGLTHPCLSQIHPGYYALRDQIKPLKIAHWTALRAGGNILLTSQETSEFHFIHAFTQEPTLAPSFPSPGDRLPIHWIAFNNCILYTDGSKTLTLLDLSNLDFNVSAEAAQNIPIPKATLEFESNIKNICGPLSDGTFFITCEPPMPVFSDVCRLCALDLDKIRQTWQQNHLIADIQAIGALSKNVLLTNTEQTLNGDCQPDQNHFITCNGGMQNKEVRFIFSDGSWTTKFIHDAPVLKIIPSELGPVSLDKTGQAFLWNGQNPIDDTTFDLDKIQNIFKENIQETDFTINWTHKRLYLSLTTPPQASLNPALTATQACCISQNQIQTETFVKKIYHLENISLVLLADGSIHFWDLNYDAVPPKWQLSKAYAEAADWNDVLNTKSPAIESDPRIRIIHIT